MAWGPENLPTSKYRRTKGCATINFSRYRQLTDAPNGDEAGGLYDTPTSRSLGLIRLPSGQKRAVLLSLALENLGNHRSHRWQAWQEPASLFAGRDRWLFSAVPV